jgi:competence protein ComEC
MSIVALVGCLIVGVVLARHTNISDVPMGYPTVIALVALTAITRGYRRILVASAAAMVIGVVVASNSVRGVANVPFSQWVTDGQSVVVRGVLIDDPVVQSHVGRATLRVDTLTSDNGDVVTGGRRHVRLSASAAVNRRVVALRFGDRVVLRGRLSPLTQRDERLRDRHIVANLRVVRIEAFSDPPWGLARIANAVRAIIERGLRSMPAREQPLARAFLLGDTSGIDDDTVAAYRSSGLSHLLAVSGANVAFVVACVAPLLQRMRMRARMLSSAAVIVVFGAMTRFEPSVLRAVAMALVALLAAYSGRSVSAVRALGVAVAVLVVLDPMLVFRTGFQLSVAATLGLTVCARPMAQLLRGPQPLREVVATPLAAQLGVLPISLATFGTVPLIAVPANVIAVPFAGPITVIGLVAALLGGIIAPIAPAVADVLQLPAAWLIALVSGIADIAADHPIPVDTRATIGLGALVALGAAVWFMRPGARPAHDAGPAEATALGIGYDRQDP